MGKRKGEYSRDQLRGHNKLSGRQTLDIDEQFAGNSVNNHKMQEDVNEDIAIKEISQVYNNS
ncbi:hypothetical protein [Texcoconibacillus texcoconensis]|uniref:Uncharacterized protein n=1 Tax=Texcoconibacillus texcoconensis TaxID=1095777 RepID=A0A840QSQ0_9BACI|nr:hypothetical protein [Texcoconibacillus texcoconensis]MBB5174297.1 hypothetical protein [Texcoconibacillus texcoconensis]